MSIKIGVVGCCFVFIRLATVGAADTVILNELGLLLLIVIELLLLRLLLLAKIFAILFEVWGSFLIVVSVNVSYFSFNINYFENNSYNYIFMIF